MAMLATLEGTETTGTDDYILSRMFSPNDGLGVELLGVNGWNYAKSKVANAARKALKAKRLFIVPEIIYCDQVDKNLNLGMAQLFGMDLDYSTELLGWNPVKAITDTAKKAISKVHKSAVSSTRKAAKSAWKEIKKQSKDPIYSAKVAISPTLQTRAISKTDPTGISTKVFEKTYKFAPDVLPNLAVDKATRESIKLDPTGISQNLYKMGKKAKSVLETTTPAGTVEYYQRQQKKQQEQQAANEIAEKIKAQRAARIEELKAQSEARRKVEAGKSAATSTAIEPTVIYQPGQTQYIQVPAETEDASGFDWSSLFNWKTFLLVGSVSYFIFGRRGGKRK